MVLLGAGLSCARVHHKKLFPTGQEQCSVEGRHKDGLAGHKWGYMYEGGEEDKRRGEKREQFTHIHTGEERGWAHLLDW